MRILLLAFGMAPSVTNGSSRYASSLYSSLRSSLGQKNVRIFWGGSRGLPRKLRSAGWATVGLPHPEGLCKGFEPNIVQSLESGTVPSTKTAHLVVTVHDVCALLRPDLVPWRIVALKRLSWLRRHNWDAIIVPSEATRQNLLHLGLPPEKINVVSPGVEVVPPRREDAAEAEEISGGRPYVLVIGNPSLKKGSDLLLKAWGAAGITDGNIIWIAKDGRMLAGKPGILRVGEVSDPLLSSLYEGSAAVVVSSRWEGYSFPVAEAMIRGIPVIASAIPAHREFGDGPHFYEVEDISQLQLLLGRAFDGALQGKLRGFPQWRDTALEVDAIYRKLL